MKIKITIIDIIDIILKRVIGHREDSISFLLIEIILNTTFII